MDFPDDNVEVEEEEEEEEEKEVEEEEKVDEVNKNEGSLDIYLRFSLLIFLSILVTFSLPIFGLIIEFLVGSISNWNPVSVPTECKILSSSVDLRYSKVCELGLLHYKAKNVFRSSDRRRFRCHSDYYWASVFEVEYFDHSGQQRLAFAEAPDEALPIHCRPNFGVAYLTKDIFEVNETYDCWYTMGLSKVNLNTDAIYNCYAKDVSVVEMLQKYSFLTMKPANFDIFTGEFFTHWKWNLMGGAIAGFITTLLSYTMVRILYKLKSILHQLSTINRQSLYQKAIFFRRVCFFIAYFSFMSWLALQYIKWFGLPDFLEDDYSW